MVKIIQADDTLSVQVHPDDKIAQKLEGKDSCGKTECWYVLDAKKDASLVHGLKENLTEEQILNAINENDVEKILNRTKVKQGDFIFIPAGTVHAIGEGLRLLEVQQNCNITYRLYDWGRGREVHIKKSFESIKSDLNTTKRKDIVALDSFECEYFSLSKHKINGGYSFFTPNLSEKSSPIQLIFIEKGKGTIKAQKDSSSYQNNDNEVQTFELGDEQIYAILPGEKITVEGIATVIRIIPA